jgi:hypothetical protein
VGGGEELDAAVLRLWALYKIDPTVEVFGDVGAFDGFAVEINKSHGGIRPSREPTLSPRVSGITKSARIRDVHGG